MELWELSAAELSGRLAAGEVSSVEIVEALRARRASVDEQVGAFVAECDDALDRAREADERRRAGEARGPLDGVPVTIKDNVDLAGYDSTLGIAGRIGRPAERDAVLVAALRRAGAVFLGKTNVPQALLAQETENRIFGVTSNPWDVTKTAGGSSGGEAAAVASGTSPLGIGTDIGGSIRIPAHFCGVVGFKPTLDRWSNRGSNTAIPGQELVRSQIGCLSRAVADAALLWRCLSPDEMARDDPQVSPVSARDPDEVSLRGLRVGVVTGDDFLAPAPSLLRAVDVARAALEDAGAVCVEHRPVPTADVLSLWLAALSSDGGTTLERSLAGDATSPQLRPSRAMMRVPRPLRRAASLVLGGLGERRLCLLIDALGEKTVADLWQITAERTALRMAEYDAWNHAGLDAVLCPPHVVAAFDHRASSDYALSVGAQFRWTLLNFPAGVVPVARVRAEDVGRYPEEDRLTRKTARLERASVGLPVGVQLVARPYREDVLLAVLRAVEAGVRERGAPRTPVTP